MFVVKYCSVFVVGVGLFVVCIASSVYWLIVVVVMVTCCPVCMVVWCGCGCGCGVVV